MTRAMAARTWSELRDLMADLPATRLAPQARPPGPLVPAAAAVRALRTAPDRAVLAGIGITTAMLVNMTHGKVGLHLAAPIRAAHRAAPELLPLHTQALRPKVLNCP